LIPPVLSQADLDAIAADMKARPAGFNWGCLGVLAFVLLFDGLVVCALVCR
jgi:hypothetical protein